MANLTKTKQKTNKQASLETYLLNNYRFRYDEIRNRIDISTNEKSFWEPLHEQSLWRSVNKNHEAIGLDYLVNTIAARDLSTLYNPIKSWFQSLKTDTSIDPFENLCQYIFLENRSQKEYIRLYISLKKWFVGAVKTLYDPYYVHKQAIIIQGSSGIGKTPFCLSLLPQKFQDLIKYAPCLDPNSKDAKIALASRFIIVLDEIDDFFKTKQNRDNYKSYMTQKIVNERLPYAKSATSRHRIAAFVGTCNESTFLNDPTGTQRFCVFSVENFKNRRFSQDDCIENFDIATCWAAAYELYKLGFNPEFTEEEIDQNEEANERYKYNSPEYETIGHYLVPAQKDDDEAIFMTSTQICTYLNSIQENVGFNNVTLGKSMIRLKFPRTQKKVNGIPLYGYYVKKLPLQPDFSKALTYGDRSN